MPDHDPDHPRDPSDPGDPYRRSPDPDADPTPRPDRNGDPAADFAYPPTADASPTPPHAGPSYVSVPCSRCGYNLTGIAIGGNCPECGALVDNSLYAAGQSPTNGFAVTSMVIGIVAATMVCCPLVSYLGVIGLVFGILALKQLNTGQYAGGSRGMAIAGVICSSLATLAALAWTVMIIADL